MRHLRFRGLKKENWEVRPLVQIGTDADYRREAKPLRERGLLEEGYDEPIRNLGYMVPDEIEYDTFLIDLINVEAVVYVSALHGNDSNDGTTRETPKKTIQAACDTAYDRGDTHIIILDSEVYTERLDIIDKHIFANEGQTPRLAYPLRAFDLFGGTSALQGGTTQYVNLSPAIEVNILFGLKPYLASCTPMTQQDLGKGYLRFNIDGSPEQGGTLNAIAWALLGYTPISYDDTIFTGLAGYTAYNYETDYPYTIRSVEIVSGMGGRVWEIRLTSFMPIPQDQNHTTWAIYPGNAIFAKSDGDDSAFGDLLRPKRTIQVAINTAVQRGYADVVLLDSAVYTEDNIDLRGRTLKKLSGENPTVVSTNIASAPESSQWFTKIYQVAEYVYNGKPCLYAATANGLFRRQNDSTNNPLWEFVPAFGNNILSGITVWQDRCVIASLGENKLVEITKAGAKINNPATIGRTFAGDADLCILLFSLGDSLLIYITNSSYGYMYDGAGWEKGYYNHAYPEETYRPLSVFYNRNYSERFAACVVKSEDTRFCKLSVINLKTLEICQRDFTACYGVEYAGNIYLLDDAGITRFAGQDYEQAVRVAAYTWPSDPYYIFFDTSGLCFVVCASHILYSRDMQNWIQIQNAHHAHLPISDRVYTYGNTHIIASEGYIHIWDRQHIRKRYSNEMCLLYGLELDGQGLALTALDSKISLTNCNIANYYMLTNPLDTSLRYFRMSRFCNIGAVFAEGSSEYIYRRVYIYDCEFIRSPVTLAAHAEIHRSSITLASVGLTILSSTCRIAECILSGNTVDILLQGESLEIESCLYETAQGAPVRDIASGGRPARYVGSPLFINPSAGDLRLKARALGYPLDSALLRDTARGPAVGLTEAIGARKNQYALTGVVYGLDYTLTINPSTVTLSWQPAGYRKGYALSGSLNGNASNDRAYKETKKLVWNTAGGDEAADPSQQAAMLRYIYSLDTVLEVGEASPESASSNWQYAFLAQNHNTEEGPHTFDRIRINNLNQNIMRAPNAYTGAWCMDGQGIVLGRIHEQSAPYMIPVDPEYPEGEKVCVMDIGWGDHDTASADKTIFVDIFRTYRIDKSQSFAPTSPVMYAPGRLPYIPTQYELTLAEVDEP